MPLALASPGGLFVAAALSLSGLSLAVLGVAWLVRRRRGPAPLSRLLLAGSLGEMQRPRPLRRGVEP
jgi:hypothetical protein